MARFIAGVSGQAPLQMQLGARYLSENQFVDQVAPAIITEISAFASADSNDGTGQVSRPVFLRPTIPGLVTDKNLIQRGQPLGVVDAPRSAAGWLFEYSAAPSTPVVGSGNFNLPLSVRYSMSRTNGIVVDDFFVLYAQALSDTTWRAHIIWEEK